MTPSRPDQQPDQRPDQQADRQPEEKAGTQPEEKADAGAPGESRGLSVLRNGISVLRSFSAAEPLLGVTDIAARVGLHKSTVSRILATLEQDGLVERDAASRRFRLGLGVIAMAGPLLADLDVRRVAQPVLEELTRRTGETSALMLWNGAGSVCVEQVASPHQVKHTTPLGTRFDSAPSASVQVFLAQLPPQRVTALLTDGSVTRTGHLRDEDEEFEGYRARLDEVRARGYAVNHGETTLEEAGVAAPVFDHRGEVAAAVLISAPRFRVPADRLPLVGEAVRAAADHVTERLGGRRPDDDAPPSP